MREGARLDYPWQIPLEGRAPGANLSKAERRREDCESLFEMEVEGREQGYPSEFVFDAEADVFLGDVGLTGRLLALSTQPPRGTSPRKI